MNKTKLTTAVAVILSSVSAPLMADTLDELNQAADGLEDISLTDLLSNEDFKMFDLDSDATDEEIRASETASVDNNNEVAINEEPVVEDLVITEPKEEKEIKVATKENKPVVFSDKIESKTVATTPEDLVFLRYVPEGTRFTVNKSYIVLPKKKYIILHNGERVLQNPQTKSDPEKNFCYIELKPSGKARILKTGKQLQVTSTISSVNDDRIKKSYGNYILRTQKIDFRVNNESIRSLSCISAKMFKEGEEAPMPLMIKDLKEQTGSVFKIEYPAYEEI